ncbi:MAG: DUF664 domain-containing protein, partial [Bryobacterales bacterium]|nr:DUF664 domain-containing protein [Bryobacterales bacterium]
MNEALVEYVRYDRWATRTTLDACAALEDEDLRRDLKASHQSIWGTLAHIYHADCVWWNRLGGGEAGVVAMDPGSSLEELRERWLALLD